MKFISHLIMVTALTLGSWAAYAQAFDEDHYFKPQKDAPAVRILGIDDTGLFFVYDLSGFGLNDSHYFSGSWKFNSSDLVNYVSILTKEDKSRQGIQCEAICVNATGEVIGLDPDFAEAVVYDGID